MNLTHTIKNPSIWNRNFILLWQGQLISEIGDLVYEIALSFYVLAKTGSTLAMSYMLTATILPRVLLSPFAGIIADKTDKKAIIVISDLVRGCLILAVGLLGFLGYLELWMLFLVGISIGIGSAFFRPTVNALLPEISTRDKIMATNAAFSLIQALASIIGYFMGGLLFGWIGAYSLFVINGVSYLISAISELFLKIDKHNSFNELKHDQTLPKLGLNTVLLEFKGLLKSVWQNTGLRYLLISNAVLNYFSFIGITLILPYFQSKKEWGSTFYGIVMGAYTLGTVLGLVWLTKVSISKDWRANLYIFSVVIFSVLLAPTPFIANFYLLLIPVFLAGFCTAFTMVIERNALHSSLSSGKQAQVFGIWSTISGSLIPLGMISAGFLAQFFQLDILIALVFGLMAIIVFLVSLNSEFKAFLRGEQC